MRIWDRLAPLVSHWTGKWNLPGHLAILPVLRAQIADVNHQMEKSVVSVCGNFSGIAERSRQTVVKMTSLLGSGHEEHNATVERSIETSRSTIAGLLERLERASKLSSVVVERMQAIEEAVAGIESLLAEVQKTAFASKLVALNAKIEAVHVGELGSGFEVVAGEITRQAERSDRLAEDIGARIREMRNRVNSAAGELSEFVSKDREKLAQSRSDAEGALNLLWSIHQRAADSLTMMAKENTELADDIARAVVEMQFQDRVGQCLTHVVEALEKVERKLGGAGQEFLVLTRQTPDSGRSLLDDAAEAYTMESERAVMARVSRQNRKEEAESDGDVELF